MIKLTLWAREQSHPQGLITAPVSVATDFREWFHCRLLSYGIRLMGKDFQKKYMKELGNLNWKFWVVFCLD